MRLLLTCEPHDASTPRGATAMSLASAGYWRRWSPYALSSSGQAARRHNAMLDLRNARIYRDDAIAINQRLPR